MTHYRFFTRAVTRVVATAAKQGRGLGMGLAISLALALSAPGYSEIFRTVDAEGNITYTDQPPTNTDRRVISETVDLPTPNTFEDTTPYERWDPESASEDDNNETSYTLLIVTPGHDQTVRENAGNVVIRTRINPDLDEGHTARLELNGTLTGNPVEGGSIYLNNLPRGTHRARLVVENENGRRIAESGESVFHMQRFSQLSPAGQAQQARQQARQQAIRASQNPSP